MAATTVLAVVVLSMAYKLWQNQWHKPLRIAAGSVPGTYHELGRLFQDIFKEKADVANVTVLETQGSNHNVSLLQSGKAELAFVQSNANISDKTKAIAVLYDEPLHILVRKNLKQNVKSVYDLAGLRVAFGPKASGTNAVAKNLIDHLKIKIADKNKTFVKLDVLDKQFAENKIDVAFVVAGLGNNLVKKLLDDDAAYLLSIGDPEIAHNESSALSEIYPFFNLYTIPIAAYGNAPGKPISTISVKAVLVGSSELPAPFVRKLLTALFEDKLRLSLENAMAAKFVDRFEPGLVNFPYHKGAIDYYNRKNPSFIVTYADPISLIFTLVAMATSALFAVYGMIQRTKKNRVDVYLTGLQNILDKTEHSSKAEYAALHQEILDIEKSALVAFKDEKLDIASFRVFQTFLQSVERRLDQREPSTGKQSPEV